MEKLIGIGELSHELGVPESRLQSLFRYDRLPRPRMVAGRKVFTARDVQVIRRRLAEFQRVEG